MKPVKTPKAKQSHVAPAKKSSGDSHVSHTSMGMGDYYGTGVRNKMGRMIEGNGMKTISKKKIGTPPKSVV